MVKRLKKKTHRLIIALVVGLCNCSYDNVTNLTLNGKWVDINTKTDTLTFGIFGGQASMILGRGKEIRNGFLLPKYGSGPYNYKLLTDKISIRWMLSGSSIFNDYYFRQTGDQLTIEKFYDTTPSGTILTFKKLD